MKHGKLSGWQLQNRRMQRLPVMPSGATRWERFLYKHALTETQVLAILKSREERSRVIRAWVAQNHDSAFIPLTVLEELKVSTRYD